MREIGDSIQDRFRIRFAIRLALRESSYGFRRIGVFMGSIALGVAALVSVHSFRADIARSVQDEADVLMGGNARFSHDRPMPPPIAAVIDSLRETGAGLARVTTTMSMVSAPRSMEVRLLQVRALDKGYPFYGDVTTSPVNRWGAHLDPDRALVDPAILTQFGIQVGDTLVLGLSRLEIAGTVNGLPTDLAYQTAIGPRVHISQATLERSGLLANDGLARFEILLQLPDIEDRRGIRERYQDVLQVESVNYSLAEEQAERLSNGVRYLARFLGLVGLGALLLGGVGVASAINVYIREKRQAIAVLRCLGAGQATAFVAYLIQAAMLGLLGAMAGVAIGVLVQQQLPTLLGNIMPVVVTTRFSPTSALAGLGIGLWVSLIFALIPLLNIREIPPLAALRHDFEERNQRWDRAKLLAYGLLGLSIVGLCVIEAPNAEIGLGFALALALAGGLIVLVGSGLRLVARRYVPASSSYPVRQGVSNLFRPQNQTVSVMLALGLGAFLIGLITDVGGNIQGDLTRSFSTGRANMLLFDVQPDQVDGVSGLLPEATRQYLEATPLVSSRIVSINGRSVEDLLDEPTSDESPRRFALGREYRNTYRERLGVAEEVLAGEWWDDAQVPGDSGLQRTDGLAHVSLEEGIADALRVTLGDTITWDVSGIRIPSIVLSLRRVDWNQLEPNFYAIFEPGVLEQAPQTVVILAQVHNDAQRARVQRELIERYPNVSALDFSRVQEVIENVLVRVRQAVGFLGIFTVLAGAIVLIGSLATSRVQRMREGALLKTLGAKRAQVLTVLFAEYFALGLVATGSGLILALGTGTILVPWIFEITYSPQIGALSLIWLGVVGITVGVGFLGSIDLIQRPPLPVLRQTPE
tara:strand:+ start:4688 stop:7291 length:2604 start_codon:yes stop_codon:yes gene_type:complete